MTDWKLEYNGYHADQEGLREALCTVGNGYFATRGAGEESTADVDHYPGTYLAGGYNRLESVVAGRTVENEDLVNWPNWLPLTFRVEDDSHWFRLEEVEIISYVQTLNIHEGILERAIHFRDYKGRETWVRSRRFISMDDPHIAAISWTLTPVNWSGRIEVRSALDGSIINDGVPRYRKLNSRHLDLIGKGAKVGSGIYLLVQSTQSKIYMAQAAHCRIFRQEEPVQVQVTHDDEGEQIAAISAFHIEKEKPVSIEKTVTVFTSRDFAISEPLEEAMLHLKSNERFDVLLQKHGNAWKGLWQRFDIRVKAKGNTQMLLRLHIFHLLQTCSMHTIGSDVGVPARGWHGEAYRGHIFWDELFIFPLLNFRMPDLTHSLLLYRYHRLNAARILARGSGLRGAMFPWQSGSSGREESQKLHLNPNAGEWVPDHTYLQRHVNLAIAYNVWQYYIVTGDIGFMRFYGAEMLLEIARFIASLSTWSKTKGRFEILKVVGPDEFHTAIPGNNDPGIDNNAYTNVMASWVLTHALQTIGLVGKHHGRDLLNKLEIDGTELHTWDKISRKLFVPFAGDNVIIAQFEGYEKLKEFDWEGYRKKYDNIQRLDRILDAEGDSVNEYKVSKQADVLMLFYLFSAEELVQLLERLGYAFDPSQIPENIKYYSSRTSDGSTLSRIVRSWVEARSDRECAWKGFRQALLSDFDDVQGGTTREGIHLGSMAGTVDILQRCLTGLEIRDNVLWVNPHFPNELDGLDMQVYYKGVWLMLKFQQQQCRIEAVDGEGSICMGFKDQKVEIKSGDIRVIDLHAERGFGE